MTSIGKNIRFFLGQFIGKSSWLHWINYYRSFYKDTLVYDDTDLCIEGFQRSGNSFFFQLMRRGNLDLKIAHHMHVPEQVKRAVARNIPTVILIRKPQDCVASLLAWDDRLSIGVALSAYCSFYESLYDIKDQFVIAKFEDVINDPLSIAERLRDHYQTDITMHIKGKKQLEKILGRISDRTKNTLSAPVPNEKKEVLKKQYKDQILKHPKLEKATVTYDAFIS